MVVITRQALKYKRDVMGLRALVIRQRKEVEALLSKRVLDTALAQLGTTQGLLSAQLNFFPCYYYAFKEQTRNALETLASAQKNLKKVNQLPQVAMETKQNRLKRVTKSRKKKRKAKQGKLYSQLKLYIE